MRAENRVKSNSSSSHRESTLLRANYIGENIYPSGAEMEMEVFSNGNKFFRGVEEGAGNNETSFEPKYIASEYLKYYFN